jgi:hypothetical protein
MWLGDLDNPAYSPENFQLFGHLKNHLSGNRLSTDADVKQAVSYWLQTIDTDFFHAGILSMVSWWKKCLSVNGKYVEV